MEAAVTPDHSEEFNAVTAALPAADADIQLDYAGDVANRQGHRGALPG